jgi:hypothetical protein
MRRIGRITACVAACLCAASFGRTAAASWPSKGSRHLAVDTRSFSASVDGFRAYLETMRSTNPALYARLVPDVERLEKRQRIELTVLITGMSLGLASVAVAAYAAITDVRDCPTAPPSAWTACDDRHVHTFATFGLIGATLIFGTMITSVALSPGRAELQELVDKHNRDCPHLIHLEVGYTSSLHFAAAGLTFSF